MDELNNENLNSEIEETDQTEEETLETDIEEDDDVETLKEKNKQLFARAKKAEGFTLKDGKWVKKEPKEVKKETVATTITKEEKRVIPPSDELDKLVEGKTRELLEKRDLESMDLPDDLKEEVSKIAKLQGISIKQASKDPYVLYKKGEWEKEQKTENSTISRTNKSSGKRAFTVDPPEVDVTTKEGAQVYEEWKRWAEKNIPGYGM